MRIRWFSVSSCLFAAALLAGCATVERPAPTAGQAALLAQVTALLEAYERNDRAAVLALVDQSELDIYGSDVSEHAVGAQAFSDLIEADHALWSRAGEVQIGAMRSVSVRMGGNFATVFFDAPFRVGANPELTVRFATVWRRRGGDWVLTQSANTVPTVNSSAREILGR